MNMNMKVYALHNSESDPNLNNSQVSKSDETKDIVAPINHEVEKRTGTELFKHSSIWISPFLLKFKSKLMTIVIGGFVAICGGLVCWYIGGTLHKQLRQNSGKFGAATQFIHRIPEQNFQLGKHTVATNYNNNLDNTSNNYNSLENLSKKEETHTSNVDGYQHKLMTKQQLQELNLFLNDPEKVKLLCESIIKLANSLPILLHKKETTLPKNRLEALKGISLSLLERIDVGILGMANLHAQVSPSPQYPPPPNGANPRIYYLIEFIKTAQLGIYVRFRLIGE